MNKKLALLLTASLGLAALFWILSGRQDAHRTAEVRVMGSDVRNGKDAPIEREAEATEVVAAPVIAADAPAPVKGFREWAVSYFKAQPQQRAAMESQGRALAAEHTREIAKLIRSDPQAAIANAVPMVLRQDLPPQIVMVLEQRIRTKGALEVFGNVPLNVGQASSLPESPKIEPYTRTVTAADGTRFNAFVFGKRAAQRTISTAQLNGIAVGKDMAVNDSTLRALEVGERPVAEGREVVEACPISGIETPVEETPDGELPAITQTTPAFETAERIVYVCSGGHIQQVAEKFASQEEYEHWQSLGVELNSGAGSGPAHGAVLGTIPGSWTTGNRTFLYIRAAFPDNPVDPQNEQECHDMLKTMSDYVLQTSYGRCYFTYAVPPLVILPYPLAWYAKYDTDVGGGDYLIQNHAIQIAKTMGYNNGSFNLWAVRWSGGPGAYGGSASVGGAGMRMKTSSAGTFIHELGHNLGVWHANFWRTTPPSITGPGNNLEYGNTFDVMGGSGSVGQYTSSFKNTLSWMPQEQFWNVTASGLYRIAQTDASTADPSQRYAMRIKRDSERDYWAEFRLQHPTNPGFTNGLFMTWDRWGLSGIGGSGGAPLNGSNAGAQLLDMTPGSFGNGITDTRNDSALWLGRTYSDPDFNIHLTPIAKNSGTTPPSMDVQVQIGDAAGNSAPTLSISASSTTPAVNGSITLTATAGDVDSDPLAYAWVFGDGSYSLNNNAVQTKSWSTAGHYQVLCTASDMKGKRTTRSVLITVGTPTTFTVSGNITGLDALPLEGVYVANFAPSNTTSHTNSATFRGTWTDSDGNYTLTGLAAGSFTITPGLYPLTFSASGFSNPVAVGPNATGKNFTCASLPAITISYPDDTANEAAVPGTATIRLTRDGPTTAAVSVQIYNSNTGSATRNTDYTLTPAPTAATSPDGGSGTSEYVIAAASSFLDITVTPVNDATAEGIEYASLDFVNTAAGYSMTGRAKAVVPIIDDESALPVVKITAVDDTGNEAGGDTLTLRVERNVVTASALNVIVSHGGTATNVTDYSAPASASIPANAASTTFVITPVNDTAIETTETIITTISTNAAYNRDGTAQSVTSTLNDDDMPVVTLAATDATASETGADKGVFTLTRTGATTAALTVDYSVGGRAVLGTDYRRLDGRAVMPAGSSTVTVEIVPFDDAMDEGTQDVILQLRTTQNYFIGGTGLATVTITDNELTQVYVELNTGNGVEPASASANGPVFQITRPATGTAITVNYTISGTATSGTDYTALPGTISFATGDGNKTITVSMLADAQFEDAETVTLTLQNGAGYTLMPGQASSMTAFIYDADQEVVDVNVADNTSSLTVPFTETSTATGEDFFISRRVSTASDLVVSYTISGTATSGDDFTALSGTATILANTTSVYVNVIPVNDTIPEGMESIILTITPVSGSYGVRQGTATLLLGDNDSFPSGTVGFAGSTATTTEAIGTYNMPVNITGTPPGDVSVFYRVNGGTAAGNGIDFTLTEGVLNFPSGTTTVNVPITITPDVLPEPAETIVVQLLNQTGANLGTSTQTITLNNVSMPEAFTDTATSIVGNGATLNGRVMPGGLATNYWFEYGPTTSYGSVTTTTSAGSGTTFGNATFALSGIAFTTCHFRLIAQNSAGSTFGIDQVFTLSNAPSAVTLAATNLTGTSATLNGTANSNGITGSAWFEWGLTASYGNTTAPQNLPAAVANVPMLASLTGLTDSTTYHCRAVIQSAVGTAYGDGMTFNTPAPTIVRTGSFAGVGQTGFSIDGVINPGGDMTDYYFEWGDDTSYGAQTATQSAGNGAANVIARTALQNLTPGGTYHIRLVATNTFGTTVGDDQEITLLPNTSDMIEPEFLYRDTGTTPLGALISGSDGFLYGTTNVGGTFNAGSVFRVSTGGTATTLASFYGNANSGSGGSNPQSNLTQAADGNFYGMTNGGGTNGNGTIFRITPDGVLTTLVSFTNASGPALGNTPVTGLTLGADGALYGVTQTGGISSLGTIFKVTTNGVLTTLVSFSGTTGSFLGSSPRGNLLLASDGNFYGTTATGGSGGGFGTVFKYAPGTSTFTTLVNLTGTVAGNLGATPTSGLVQGTDGNFYGATSAGGNVGAGLGTVFMMTPAGALTTLVNFGGLVAPLGSSPKGTLVFGSDGQLYGTTQTGGTVSTGLGTVFKCTTAGVLTTLVNFSGSTGVALGQSPNGGLVAHADGGFYGTTSTGGVNNVGTIFRISASGELSTLVNLTAAPTLAKLKQASDGNFYGTTTGAGGSLGHGTVLKGPPGGAMSVVTTLVPTVGTTAWASRGGFMQAANGDMWATSAAGGIAAGNSGAVFKISPAGVMTTVTGFGGTVSPFGSSPQSELILGADGQHWGTTSTGGSTVSLGTIFKVNTAGTLTTVLSFSGTTAPNLGSSPQSPLTLGVDGNYYGMTSAGGNVSTGFGTLYKVTPAGVQTTLVNFTGPSGANPGASPQGAMVQATDGNFYGTTNSGGVRNLGTVFRMTPAGMMTSLASFGGNNIGELRGQNPIAGLVAGPGGAMYGVTNTGGIYNQGTLFRVTVDGSVTSLYSFSGRDAGVRPDHGLALASDGSLRGVTSMGIYKFNAPPVPVTLAATSVTGTSATLNGTVTPGALGGTMWLEHGVGSSFTSSTTPQSFSAGTSALPVNVAVTGLQPFLTYQVRAVASCSLGVFYGGNVALVTSSNATFNAATDVPVSIDGFTASGITPALALAYAPAAGTVLTLVSNTGFLPVSGTFNGLPDGAGLTVMFGASPYLFQISYSGGDGNDITLTRVDQLITFPSIPTKYVGDAAFNLTATSTSGLLVSYQIVAGATSASVTGSTVTLTATTGTITVKATQPGDGGSIGAAIPVYQTFSLAAASTGFTVVTASKGTDFALGIRANGTLWAWGINASGQLGDASTSTRRTPVQVGTATNWRTVSAGTSHVVATRTDGSMWAWGLNTSSQVGDNTVVQKTAPAQIGTTSDWANAVAGATHCVAVKTDGTLWAWGGNTNGQCGQGNVTTTIYAVPTQIGAGTTWRQVIGMVSAGGDFTLALQTDGTLWAWGLNTSSQLGDGTAVLRSAPVQIGTATNWSRVAPGTAFSAAIKTDGTLWTWGLNSSGQNGDGSLTNRSAPAQVGAATDWQGIVAGGAHVIAKKSGGAIWTWGANPSGQLGQGIADTLVRPNAPMQMNAVTDWGSLAGGTNFSVATRADGTLWAWGSNANGQLGYFPRTALPVSAQFGQITSASGGANHTVLIRPDGSLWGFGLNSSGQLGLGFIDTAMHQVPVKIGGSFSWSTASAGSAHTMAIRADGTLWGCGANGSGQLGDGNVLTRSAFVQIGGDTNWRSVVAANTHTLALKTDGSIWAWGSNASGQLGDGTLVTRLTPKQVGIATDWNAIWAGNGGFSMAMKSDGTLWTWGEGTGGQLGNGGTADTTAPAQVGIAGEWKAISAGANHVLAVKANGTLWAWGVNSSNQLGDGTTTQRNIPTQIGAVTTWAAVSGAAFNSLATRTDGTLWTWGANTTGYLGTGNHTVRSAPGQVGTSTGWSSLPPLQSSAHSLAIAADSTLWAFGFATSGQCALAWRNQLVPDLVLPAISPVQSITFTAPPASVAVGNTITLSTTTGSGLPAGFIVTGPATRQRDQLTITGPGLVSVTAYQPGDSFWQSSDMVQRFINIPAPSVTTLAATSVGTTTATINATINPNGSATTAQFQRGTTTGYGTNSAITLSPNNGTIPQNVALNLTGLTSGTTYHFRSTATNTGGTTNGEDVVFTTISNNANLSALAVSAGTLSPAFASATISYTAAVPNTTSTLTLTPTAANSFATITVKNTPVSSGAASGAITLNVGANVISTVVTAQDGTPKTYTITVTRRSAYEDWAAASGVIGGSSGMMGDFDFDGILNTLEWAFGTDPSTGTHGAITVSAGVVTARGGPATIGPEGARLALFARRLSHVADGLEYVVEFSADLDVWEESLDDATPIGDDGVIEAVTVPYPAEVNGQPPQFFRVKVTAQ